MGNIRPQTFVSVSSVDYHLHQPYCIITVTLFVLDFHSSTFYHAFDVVFIDETFIAAS